MELLIVNTLPEDHSAARPAVQMLSSNVTKYGVINAHKMNISPCMGCNACWLKTPGICTIKDGYEDILKAYLEYDVTVFLAGTALNFVDYRMKNVIDRMLPLATMYIHIINEQCRHVPRYHKKYRFGLLYDGTADQKYLNKWMGRVAMNFGGTSFGAYPIGRAEEVISCI